MSNIDFNNARAIDWAWKVSLIEQANPNWNDLYDDIVQLENRYPIRHFGYDGKCEVLSHRQLYFAKLNHQALQPSSSSSLNRGSCTMYQFKNNIK